MFRFGQKITFFLIKNIQNGPKEGFSSEMVTVRGARTFSKKMEERGITRLTPCEAAKAPHNNPGDPYFVANSEPIPLEDIRRAFGEVAKLPYGDFLFA